ncbi:MAG: hypothetical protein OXB99_04345 [Acidimicrobiaceae bacterium]|nr:hypothetical protein [Acidimicrobiaceae bacterium]
MSPQQSAREALLILREAVADVLTNDRPMAIPEIIRILDIEQIHDPGSSQRSVYNRVEHIVRYALSALEVEGVATKTPRGWLLAVDR